MLISLMTHYENKRCSNASKEYVSRIKDKFKTGFILFSGLSVKSIPVPGELGKNYLLKSSHRTHNPNEKKMMIPKHKILTHDVRLSSVKKYFQLDKN